MSKFDCKHEIEEIQSLLCHPLNKMIDKYGKVKVKRAICSIMGIKSLDEKLPKYRMLTRTDKDNNEVLNDKT